MEIKGLAVSFANAKKRISEARAATGKFDVTVGAFISSLDDVTTQVDAMHSDLKFEAETLGNGGGNSAEGSVEPAQSGVNTPVGAKPSEVAHLPKVG